ncbi:O-antigen ligase domain-containing protein, partial [Acinetobacter baumannii]
EWGIIGLIFCIWMLTQLIGLFKDKTVSLILKVGVIAVLVDAMFSGSMVYPASQIACVLFIAFTFSHRELTSSSQYSSRSTKILIA